VRGEEVVLDREHTARRSRVVDELEPVLAASVEEVVSNHDLESAAGVAVQADLHPVVAGVLGGAVLDGWVAGPAGVEGLTAGVDEHAVAHQAPRALEADLVAAAIDKAVVQDVHAPRVVDELVVAVAEREPLDGRVRPDAGLDGEDR